MTGIRKGTPIGIAEMQWDSPTFDHYYANAPELESELRDLTRDANRYAVAEYVRHEVPDDIISRTFTPEIPSAALTNEEEFQKWIDAHVERGEK